MEWDKFLEICEYPFVHKGMTFEEFVEEKEYYFLHQKNIEKAHMFRYRGREIKQKR